MRKIIYLSSIVLLSIGLLTMTSCSKDEEEEEEVVVDVRDQAIGSYDGETLIFLATDTGTAISTLDQDFSIKKSNNALSINFVIDGNVEFVGSKIAKGSNGFTFDIESQTFIDEGNTYTISGINLVELGGTKYHGAYETSSKEIGAAFNITKNGVNYVMLFGGTKQ